MPCDKQTVAEIRLGTDEKNLVGVVLLGVLDSDSVLAQRLSRFRPLSIRFNYNTTQ